MKTSSIEITETNPDVLCSGTPSFRDPHFDVLARHDGVIAAWRAAAARGARAAAAAASGSYAIALRNDDGSVFMAVDRFASRPLCFREVDGELRFASRADELARGTDLDWQSIFDYLYFHVIPAPRTIFRGVHRLPAGSCATWKAGRLTIETHTPPVFTDDEPCRFEEAADMFRTLLQQAVEAQLDGSKPACFLSGGTDSSTVAGMMSRLTDGEVSTFSIGFEAEGYDEMEYARIAARHFTTRHHEYYVTPTDLVRSIAEVAQHFDQPFGNSSALPAYYCARVARDHGVTRLLAGDGGDELFGGNARYAKQRVMAWYQQVPQALRAGVLEPALERTPLGRLPLMRKGRSYVSQAKVAMPQRAEMYNLLLRLGVDEVLTPGFKACVDVEAPLRLQCEVWAQARTRSEVNRTLAYDWRFTLADSDLPKVCGAASLAGVDVAFPMLDDRLVEFSTRLPPKYKLNGLQLRWFFKESLRGFLPNKILRKKKQGFGLPFGPWAVKHPPLLSLARDSLLGLASRGIVEPRFIDSLLDRRLAEHPGYYGEMVWILMMLEQWLRRNRPDARFVD